MFGNNNILKPESHDGSSLDIVEIFPTIQGEGPFAGQNAVFIRLGGCNLACDFCDTEFDQYQKLSLNKIIETLDEFAARLVVITGGEPLRQPIEKLCTELLKRHYQVQIESNGTIYRDLPKAVSLVCSPKISNGQYHAIRPDLLSKISAFKFIVSKNKEEYSSVSEVGQSIHNIPVYVQPMDEYDDVKNKENTDLAVRLCQQNNYILSLQIHKILHLK